MSTITKERIELFIKNPIDNSLSRGEQMELARIALASLEAEAIAVRARWKDEGSGHGDWRYYNIAHRDALIADETRECELIYTAHPAPVSVPDAATAIRACMEEFPKDVRDIVEECASIAENACRSAMLQDSEPVTMAYRLPEETGSLLQLRNLIRKRHAEWSQATFGDVGPMGPLKHLSKEALEAAAEPEDLSEWADMQFLLWDAQRALS